MQEEIPSPKQPNKADQRESTLWTHAYGGTQLAVSVLAGLGLGYYLDRKFGWAPWLMLGGGLLGFLAGLYSFLKPFLKK